MVAVVMLALSALACPSTTRDAESGLDDFGDPIVLADTSASARIISLDPSVTEIVFALGMGSRLVGRTHWDLFSDSVRAVPDVGDGIRPNVEAILQAHPTLVFLYASEENRDAARQLRAAGIDVVTLRVDRIADFVRVTSLIGRLTHREDRARTVVDSVSATLERVRHATAGRPRITVFMFAWESPLLTIGGGSFLTELISIAGAENVFADLKAPSPQVSFEEVLRRNPDVVLGGPKTVAMLRSGARWRALPAVRNGRLLVMDTILVARPSVRLGEAAVSLAQLFHPGALP